MGLAPTTPTSSATVTLSKGPGGSQWVAQVEIQRICILGSQALTHLDLSTVQVAFDRRLLCTTFSPELPSSAAHPSHLAPPLHRPPVSGYISLALCTSSILPTPQSSSFFISLSTLSRPSTSPQLLSNLHLNVQLSWPSRMT